MNPFFPLGLATMILLGACSQQDPCPYYRPNCNDVAAGTVTNPVKTDAVHATRTITITDVSSLEGIILATTGQIERFLEQDTFKITFSLNSHLYLLLPASDTGKPPRILQVDQGDEDPHTHAGDPSSPQFSPDGKWLAFSGDVNDNSKSVSFLVPAKPGSVTRQPILSSNNKTNYPRWYREHDTDWVYVTNFSGLSFFNATTNTLDRATFRFPLLGDSVGSVQPATVKGKPVPGAFRGGISRGGTWMGTSYASTVLWQVGANKLFLLNNGDQQCNPSMNPFDSGSANADYMMLLGFGGDKDVPTLSGPLREAEHQNLWIWNQNDKAVWQAKLPNTDEVPGTTYTEWQRPMWSTSPDFATALARHATGEYDLLVVRVTNHAALANANRASLSQRGGVLRLAAGNFASNDWSHLWTR